MSSPFLDRRDKGIQYSRVDRIVTAVIRKIRRFDPVIRHRMHQICDRGTLGHIVQDDCALRVVRNGFDGRVVLVIGVGVLKVENGVGPIEELRWGIDPRIKDHGRNV